MSDKATRDPLAVIEANLEDRNHVRLFGQSYLIKHREDLGFGDLVRLDAIYRDYAHLMTMATGGKIDQLTDEQADSLEQPMRDMVAMYLEGITPSVVAALKPTHLVTLMFAFSAALGTRPSTPTPQMNRTAKRTAEKKAADLLRGTKSSRGSSASTAATRGRGSAGTASR